MSVLRLRPEKAEYGKMDEAELIGRLQRRDRQALEEVFHRYQGRIYGLCLKLNGNPADARDLCQDAFVRLFEKAGSYRGQGKFSTWFQRLASRLVIDEMRKRKRLVFPEPSEPGEDFMARVPAETSENPGAGLRLQQALGRLPEGYRVVFLLHDAFGYSHEEIGELCGFSTGNSKSQLSRARRRLREMLYEGA